MNTNAFLALLFTTNVVFLDTFTGQVATVHSPDGHIISVREATYYRTNVVTTNIYDKNDIRVIWRKFPGPAFETNEVPALMSGPRVYEVPAPLPLFQRQKE